MVTERSRSMVTERSRSMSYKGGVDYDYRATISTKRQLSPELQFLTKDELEIVIREVRNCYSRMVNGVIG